MVATACLAGQQVQFVEEVRERMMGCIAFAAFPGQMTQRGSLFPQWQFLVSQLPASMLYLELQDIKYC